MAKYKIEIKKSIVKELKAIPKRELRKIVQKISALASNPSSEGSKKLSSEEKYRIRLGDYRILYEINDFQLLIYVIKVGHRKDVYK